MPEASLLILSFAFFVSIPMQTSIDFIRFQLAWIITLISFIATIVLAKQIQMVF
ncbi:hypothetical protein BH10BAC3_BH10BAC3_01060 [soil metagenome]